MSDDGVAGAYNCIKLADTAEFAEKHGAILITGGGLALQPYAGYLPLSMDKAALRAMVQALTSVLNDKGIYGSSQRHYRVGRALCAEIDRRAVLEVSAIGMGCMGFTHAYGECPPEAEGIKLVHKAFELGCNFFDTAEMISPKIN